MKKQRYDVTGMSCASCSAHVEKAVAGLDGMKSCQVNLLTNSMTVEYDEAKMDAEGIEKAVEHAGYGAALHEEGNGAENAAGHADAASRTPGSLSRKELEHMKFRLRVSFIFLLPLMYLTMGHMVGLPHPPFLHGPENSLAYAFTQFLLVLPVMYVNRKYYISGIKALLHGGPNMDSLISVGSLAAFIYGIAGIYAIGYALGRGDLAAAKALHEDLYFESVSMILTLITLGKYFETKSKAKTSEAIGKLLNLAPKKANVIRDGKECAIPTEQVRSGDILIVRPGESIPVDGVLEEGNTSVDESAITGESMPADKKPGDLLTGATINGNGSIRMEATRVGEDSTLSRIVRLVEEASSSKAPISKLADKISGIFVPVVMGIALLTFVIWMGAGYGLSFALSRAIAVLVISCPCALGLATPVAIMVGTGKGAEYGILFKSAEALETLHEAGAIVLDKTGTVTTGKPAVTDLLPAAGISREEFLSFIAAAEEGSEHPLAQAVKAEGRREAVKPLRITGFENLPGRGIRVTVEGHPMTGGNERPADAPEEENSALRGKTRLYFTRDGKYFGTAAVADTIKPDSAAAVKALRDRGLKVVLLTGDREDAAKAIAEKAGITEVISGVLPDRKESEIRTLKAAGNKVIMVGDGINDSPALARADVGIAIGAGTDIAIDSADVVLMRSSLMDAVTAIDLSKAVIRNIKENLFWAFFYNSIGIPLAAGAFYLSMGWKLSPMFGAAAMSMSSVCVVSNALRLKGFRPKVSFTEPVSGSGEHENGNTERDGNQKPGGNGVSEDNRIGKTEDGKIRKTEENRIGATKESEIGKTRESATNATEKNKNEKKENGIMKTTIKVNGMMCGHCKATVEKALKALPGVTAAEADLTNKQAVIEHDDTVTADVLVKAVVDAGYEASK